MAERKIFLPATTAVFATVALDMLSAGIIFPILPKLIAQLGAASTSTTAFVLGLFGSSWMLLQIVANPVQGWLSDRFGRKPVLAISNLGMGIDYVFMSLAPSLLWLGVGRLISGFLAGSYSAASAYIIDVTPPAKRAANLGLLAAAFGLGYAIGPALGGALGSGDVRLPFIAAAALSLANFLLCVIVLPESLPAQIRQHAARASLGLFATSAQMFRNRPQLLGWASARFLQHLAETASSGLLVIYTQHRFGWTPATVGFLLTFFGVTRLASAAGAGTFVHWLGERRAMIAGFAAQVAGIIGNGLAGNGLQFAAFAMLIGIGTIGNAAQSAIIASQVDAARQGWWAGLGGGIFSAAGFVGPMLFSAIFIATLSSPLLPQGTPFLAAACMSALSLGLAMLLSRNPAALAADIPPVSQRAP